MRNKNRHSKKRPMPLKFRIFAIRFLASAIIFGAAFLSKMYIPGAQDSIYSMISYNTDFEYVSSAARNIILKYSPDF